MHKYTRGSSILDTCDADFRKVSMVQSDLEKTFDRVCHDLWFLILEYVGVGAIIKESVKMTYNNCTTNPIINDELTEGIEVRSSVRQCCPLSPFFVCNVFRGVVQKIFTVQMYVASAYEAVKGAH